MAFSFRRRRGSIEEEANNWYSDYIELIECRRNPGYGKTKCFHCLLSPDTEQSALFIRIRITINKYRRHWKTRIIMAINFIYLQL